MTAPPIIMPIIWTPNPHATPNHTKNYRVADIGKRGVPFPSLANRSTLARIARALPAAKRDSLRFAFAGDHLVVYDGSGPDADGTEPNAIVRIRDLNAGCNILYNPSEQRDEAIMNSADCGKPYGMK